MQSHVTVLLPYETLQFKQLEQIRLVLNDEILEIVELRTNHYEERVNYRTNWHTYIFSLQTSLHLSKNINRNKMFFQHLEETRKAIEIYLGRKPQISHLTKEFPALLQIDIDRNLMEPLMCRQYFFNSIN